MEELGTRAFTNPQGYSLLHCPSIYPSILLTRIEFSPSNRSLATFQAQKVIWKGKAPDLLAAHKLVKTTERQMEATQHRCEMSPRPNIARRRNHLTPPTVLGKIHKARMPGLKAEERGVVYGRSAYMCVCVHVCA